MSKIQLKLYTQYIPISKTFNIYKDTTDINKSDNNRLELVQVRSAQNNFDGLSDKEFIEDTIKKFRKDLQEELENTILLEEEIFITFSKLPDVTPEYYLNSLNLLWHNDIEA